MAGPGRAASTNRLAPVQPAARQQPPTQAGAPDRVDRGGSGRGHRARPRRRGRCRPASRAPAGCRGWYCRPHLEGEQDDLGDADADQGRGQQQQRAVHPHAQDGPDGDQDGEQQQAPVTGRPLHLRQRDRRVPPAPGHQVRPEEERRPGGQAAEGADDAVEPHAGVEAGHPDADEHDQRHVQEARSRPVPPRRRPWTGSRCRRRRRTAPAGRCRGRSAPGRRRGRTRRSVRSGPGRRPRRRPTTRPGRAGCR